MKILVVLTVFFAANSFAGQCRVEFASHEPGQLRFMTINPHASEVANLEACVRKVQLRLGKTVRARAFMRDEHRLLTSGTFRYVGDGVSASGTINRQR